MKKTKLIYFNIIIGIFLFAFLSIFPASNEGSEVTNANPNPNAKKLAGFDGMDWGSSFTKVKEYYANLSIDKETIDDFKILNAVNNEFLLVSRNKIRYEYRFYQPPKNILSLISPSDDKNANSSKLDHPEYKYGRLFYVGIRLPLILAEDVQKKLVKNYGEFNSSYIDKKDNGVFIWKLNGGYIFLWQEKIADILYTRRVDYFSQKIVDELHNHIKVYFTAKEKNFLRKAKF